MTEYGPHAKGIDYARYRTAATGTRDPYLTIEAHAGGYRLQQERPFARTPSRQVVGFEKWDSPTEMEYCPYAHHCFFNSTVTGKKWLGAERILCAKINPLSNSHVSRCRQTTKRL